ncbi:hypothetical protein [Shewanella algicola]|uniref:hypothetical protein n=1 Tax=Shewanella algicola TaxID=640633 RepID=UPI0024948008|nr:hypothetical protein [Shewanella algicola]
MIILVKYTDVLELVVIRAFIMIICLLLVSCERYQGIENNQISSWVNDNSQLLMEFSNKSIQVSASGEISTMDDFVNLQASFLSETDKISFKRTVDNLLKQLNYSDEKLTFNLGLKSKHKSIYITLYQSGFCAAVGDCLDTFLVYYLDNQEVINDQNYKYFPTEIEGWYLLKISNN